MELCQWCYDDSDDYYETNCGETFAFIDGGPELNRFRFCPYCGKLIQQLVEEA